MKKYIHIAQWTVLFVFFAISGVANAMGAFPTETPSQSGSSTPNGGGFGNLAGPPQPIPEGLIIQPWQVEDCSSVNVGTVDCRLY